ncbi:NEP1-interacting protein 2-like isoform X2 [Carica papaya]|uniref:NEP1-interacting protein 2-like isoform X2 n=1 Tax=Carica papaya TaxID=3649 RepID=UPI000B8C9FAB|nr:NEP1-interacting protein 2-like isoform X2 [Carica papaya]
MLIKGWFLGIIELSLSFKEAVSFWVLAAMEAHGTGLFVKVLKRTLYAAFTCTFAMGGAVVGIVVGAIKGQTTETGFLRGGGIGAVAGAITAVQLLESMVDGESLSKFALLGSLMSGKVFMEWMMALENSYREITDIYEDNGVRGLSRATIQNLPSCVFNSSHQPIDLCHELFGCSICLQEVKDGEMGRKLPQCGHLFHITCIDEWLVRQGSCPMCRKHV